MLQNTEGILFEDIEAAITAVFAVQLVVKFVAWGPTEFWRDVRCSRRFCRLLLTPSLLCSCTSASTPSSPSSW